MDTTRALLAIVAGVAALVAVAVGPGTLSVGLGALAVVLAGYVAASAIASRSVRREWIVEVPESDSLVILRESFRGGPLGRQAIIATVLGLEHSLGRREGGLPPAEQERLRAVPPEEFRHWLVARLDSLEGAT